MEKEELVNFIKENMEIKILWLDSQDMCVALYLCGKEISRSEYDTGFSRYNHTHSEYN